MRDTCQTARDFGTVFTDEFLRWCFMNGHYTPLQVFVDMAVRVFVIAAGFGILAYYFIVLFRRR